MPRKSPVSPVSPSLQIESQYLSVSDGTGSRLTRIVTYEESRAARIYYCISTLTVILINSYYTVDEWKIHTRASRQGAQPSAVYDSCIDASADRLFVISGTMWTNFVSFFFDVTFVHIGDKPLRDISSESFFFLLLKPNKNPQGALKSAVTVNGVLTDRWAGLRAWRSQDRSPPVTLAVTG